MWFWFSGFKGQKLYFVFFLKIAISNMVDAPLNIKKIVNEMVSIFISCSFSREREREKGRELLFLERDIYERFKNFDFLKRELLL